MKLKKRNCKICGKPALPNRAICWTHHLEKQRELRKASVARQVARRATKRAKLVESYPYLHKKAWSAFSKHVRLKYADENGMVKCYTCTTVKHYKEMHAGHLWHERLDFDERNVHPQCYQCNVGHSGRREVYSINLLEEGVDLVLLRRDAETKIYTTHELKEIIKKYADNESNKKGR